MKTVAMMAAWLVAGAVLAEEKAMTTDRDFASLDSVRPRVRVQKNPKWNVAADGSYFMDGRLRFLVGPQVGEGLIAGYRHTAGYDASLNWLYEQPLTWEAAQRLGFDTHSLFVTDGWLNSHGIRAFLNGQPNEEKRSAENVAEIGLPIYVDFTAAGWSHGRLHRTDKIPAAANNTGGMEGEANHWVPYSCTTPEGRALYKEMFQYGTKWLRDAGGDALFYELFNEPAYHDPSEFNKKAFAEFVKGKYGTIEKLNSTWRSSYRDFGEIANFKTRGDNPGLFVDWSIFMEESFANLCKDATGWIAEIDPRGKAPTAVQPMGGDFYRTPPKGHINPYTIGQYCDVIALPTDAGHHHGFPNDLPPANTIETSYSSRDFSEGIFQRHYYRSIARGKPLYNGEAYLPFDAEGIQQYLWSEMLRGSSACYLFKWDKRAWDWKNDKGEFTGDEEAGKRQAKMFNYQMLNTWARPAILHTEYLRFKSDLYQVDDIFVSRDNRWRPEIAMLQSNATGRWSQATGNPIHHECLTYAAALEFGHYPYDVVLEEQMPQGRLDEYKVLIAAGVTNVYPETRKQLSRWVQAGGTLITGIEMMQEDDYGHLAQWNMPVGEVAIGAKLSLPSAPVKLSFPQDSRLPGAISAKPYRELKMAGWQVLGECDGTPVVFMKQIGAGRMYHINARMPEYALVSLLGGLLADLKQTPSCELLREDGQLLGNVEVHRREAGGLTGFALLNWDSYPKLAFLRADALSAAAVVDPVAKAQLETRDGKVAIVLPPRSRTILVAGAKEALTSRFRDAKPQSFDAIVADGKARIEQATAAGKKKAGAATGEAFAYRVDTSRVKLINLKPFVNRAFEDQVPGDGKGGWTDQGENSLHGMEWGQQSFLGVPFDIIRWDMNEGRSVLTMYSDRDHQNCPKEVRGIPVEAKAKRLYFLHATAWSDNIVDFTYIVNYADGTKAEFPVVGGRHVAEWWLNWLDPKDVKPARIAWRNSDQRGFWICPWDNPHPQKEIASLDIVKNPASGSIPVIIGITAEGPSEEDLASKVTLSDGTLPKGWTTNGWGGTQLIEAANVGPEGGKVLYLKPGGANTDWAGALLQTGGEGIPLTPELKKGKLVLLVNGAPDEWGKPVGGQSLQISLGGRQAGGPYIHIGEGQLPDGGLDDKPGTWQRVLLPMDKLLAGRDIPAITKLNLQWHGKCPTGGLYIAEVKIIP